MTLEEILQQLQYGELSQLKIGELDTPKRRKEVVAHVNLGLTDLHKRFWLKTKEILVQITPGFQDYLLDARYARSNTLSPVTTKYILDSGVNNFSDELLKIERLFDDEGNQLPLNDDHRKDSFFTPSFNILRAPLSYEKDYVLIEYRANHPKLDIEGEDVCSSEIDIPIALVEPLLLYVAHRAFRSLNSDQKQESTDYMNLYEAACLRIMNLGYQIVPDRTNLKLDKHGWV